VHLDGQVELVLVTQGEALLHAEGEEAAGGGREDDAHVDVGAVAAVVLFDFRELGNDLEARCHVIDRVWHEAVVLSVKVGGQEALVDENLVARIVRQPLCQDLRALHVTGLKVLIKYPAVNGDSDGLGVCIKDWSRDDS